MLLSGAVLPLYRLYLVSYTLSSSHAGFVVSPCTPAFVTETGYHVIGVGVDAAAGRMFLALDGVTVV
jgi:hypothetical protein